LLTVESDKRNFILKGVTDTGTAHQEFRPLPKSMDSEDLQGVFIGISTALTLGRFEDAPMENLLKKAQDLVATGQLNEDLLQKVTLQWECSSGLAGTLAAPLKILTTCCG